MTGRPIDPETESVRIRLLKVLRLAQEGVGGERENAEVLLSKLLRKHNMSLADLEGALDQPRSLVWLPASDAEERIILAQLIAKLFGTSRKVWQGNGMTNAGVDVTPSEHAALVIAWEVYRAAFVEARHALVLGFCYKHNLYSPEGATAADLTPEAQAKAAQALSLAEALPTVDSPTRRVRSSGRGNPDS